MQDLLLYTSHSGLTYLICKGQNLFSRDTTARITKSVHNQMHRLPKVSNSQMQCLMSWPVVFAKCTSRPVLMYVNQMPNKPSGKEQ